MNWNPFYLVWSDAIRRVRKSNPGMKDWKWKIFLYMTTIQALNLWIVLFWLKYFELINVDTLKLDILPGSILDGFISFAVAFASPFYMFSIPILAFISAILYGILTK
jgi:polyferredoxin